jgi:hypothetical protein
MSLALIMASCRERRTDNEYEVSTRDKANFSLECYSLYPNEKLQVRVNDTVLYEKVGNNLDNDIHKYFFFPSKIDKIQVISTYEGKKVYSKEFIDTLIEVSRLNLFISMPYPKGAIISNKPNWKPNWGKLSIDSADRIIRLEVDTIHEQGI